MDCNRKGQLKRIAGFVEIQIKRNGYITQKKR